MAKDNGHFSEDYRHFMKDNRHSASDNRQYIGHYSHLPLNNRHFYN